MEFLAYGTLSLRFYYGIIFYKKIKKVESLVLIGLGDAERRAYVFWGDTAVRTLFKNSLRTLETAGWATILGSIIGNGVIIIVYPTVRVYPIFASSTLPVLGTDCRSRRSVNISGAVQE